MRQYAAQCRAQGRARPLHRHHDTLSGVDATGPLQQSDHKRRDVNVPGSSRRPLLAIIAFKVWHDALRNSYAIRRCTPHRQARPRTKCRPHGQVESIRGLDENRLPDDISLGAGNVHFSLARQAEGRVSPTAVRQRSARSSIHQKESSPTPQNTLMLAR